MPWLIVTFIGGLLIGGLATATYTYNHFFKQKLLKLEIELTNAECQIVSLQEMNLACLDHASQLLTRWIDYRREHGAADEDYY